MKCQEFRRLYKPFVEDLQWDIKSKKYGQWIGHLNACTKCCDWYQLKQVESWGADPSKYPCVHVAYHSAMHCDQHKDAWECVDTALACIDNVFGIPVRDGGPSFIEIKYCPWCGIELPGVKPPRGRSTRVRERCAVEL